MLVIAFANDLLGSVLEGSFELTSFDVLLGIVPSAARVGGREGNLDSRHDATGQKATGGLISEQPSCKEWGDNDESTWGNHFLERGSGRDSNASFVVRVSFCVALDEWNLSVDLNNHILGSITNGAHGKGREPVWKHSSDKETSKCVWFKNVNTVNSCSLFWSCLVFCDSCDVCTEESKSDKACRSNSETFSDGGCSVSCSIQFISTFADIFLKV